MRRRHSRSTLFPYTTLFRSLALRDPRTAVGRGVVASQVARDQARGHRFGEVFLTGDDRADRLQQRSEEHTSELQSHHDLVCRLLLEKKKKLKPFQIQPPARI